MSCLFPIPRGGNYVQLLFQRSTTDHSSYEKGVQLLLQRSTTADHSSDKKRGRYPEESSGVLIVQATAKKSQLLSNVKNTQDTTTILRAFVW